MPQPDQRRHDVQLLGSPVQGVAVNQTFFARAATRLWLALRMLRLFGFTGRVFSASFALSGFGVSLMTGQGLLIPRVSPASTVRDVFTLVPKRVLKLAVGAPLKVHHIGGLCTKISNEETGTAGTGLLTLLRGTADICRFRRLAHRPKEPIAKAYANRAAAGWRWQLSRHWALSLKQGSGTFSTAAQKAPKPALRRHDLPF